MNDVQRSEANNIQDIDKTVHRTKPEGKAAPHMLLKKKSPFVTPQSVCGRRSKRSHRLVGSASCNIKGWRVQDPHSLLECLAIRSDGHSTCRCLLDRACDISLNKQISLPAAQAFDEIFEHRKVFWAVLSSDELLVFGWEPPSDRQDIECDKSVTREWRENGTRESSGEHQQSSFWVSWRW